MNSLEVVPFTLYYVLDHLKTEEMCIKSVEDDPYTLEFVPGHLKTQEMCNQSVHPVVCSRSSEEQRNV